MAPQASKKCGLLSPDYNRIGSCTSNGINRKRFLAPSPNHGVATDDASRSHELPFSASQNPRIATLTAKEHDLKSF